MRSREHSESREFGSCWFTSERWNISKVRISAACSPFGRHAEEKWRLPFGWKDFGHTKHVHRNRDDGNSVGSLEKMADAVASL